MARILGVSARVTPHKLSCRSLAAAATLSLLLTGCTSLPMATSQDCITAEDIEGLNRFTDENRLFELNGKYAKVFLALDPRLLTYKEAYARLIRQDVDRVVAWNIWNNSAMAAAALFSDGCVVEGYGEPDWSNKLQMMHEAVVMIEKDGLDQPSVRDIVKRLLGSDYQRSDEQAVDRVIDRIRLLLWKPGKKTSRSPGSLAKVLERKERLAEISPDEITEASLGDTPLIYGRIRWIQNDKERTKYKHTFGWNIWPKYSRLDDMVNGSLNVKADGTFAWQLPTGFYVFHQIHWFDSWDGPHRFTPKVAFEVPEDANTLCLGTLVVDLHGKRDIIGGLWVKDVKIRIDDECDELAAQLRLRSTDPELHHAKSLMVFDPYMPDRPEQLEDRDRALDFIRALTPGLMTIY